MSALRERRFRVELRRRGSAGVWAGEPKQADLSLEEVIRRHPSPTWAAAMPRIVLLDRLDHTRVELDDDTALILERT